MRIPSEQHRVADVIDRSRFITTLAHAPTPEAARAFIDAVRAEFPDATHHCWAYVAGPPGSTARIGMSDAGEPHGTAGRPMLDVLLHSDVGEVAAVVTRYYGGIKLGTGGLARAYAGGVKHALVALPTVEKVERVQITIAVGYADVEWLRRTLDAFDANVTAEQYAEDVSYDAAVPATRVEELLRTITDRTAGRARITRRS